MVLRVGSFLPFHVTGYFNGHNFIERELIRCEVPYHKDDNRFVSVRDPEALQPAANRLSGEMLQERMEHWTLILGWQCLAALKRSCHRKHFRIPSSSFRPALDRQTDPVGGFGG